MNNIKQIAINNNLSLYLINNLPTKHISKFYNRQLPNCESSEKFNSLSFYENILSNIKQKLLIYFK